MVINSIVLFLPVKFISVCRIFPEVLSRPTIGILRTKVSQDLAVIRWMSGDMYETNGFVSILHVVYIYFPTIDISLTRFGVIIWWGSFSSRFPDMTNTIDIYPSRFLIIRFYSTFVNRFWNFHVFKDVNNFVKINIFTIKSLYILLLDPAVGNTV